MKGLALLLAAASCAALPLAAQTTVRVGQTVTGTLADGDPRMENGAFYDTYVIRGQPGQRVVVRMQSAMFDAYLRWGYEAEDGVWDEIAYDDDGGEGTDARMLVVLNDQGRYELRATAFGEDDEGAYELSLSEAQAVPARRVRVGETVQGELTDGDFDSGDGPEDQYVISGRAGEVVTVFAESEDFDTYLSYGPDEGGEFEELGADDDAGTGSNSQLVVVFEEGEAFRVAVRSFAGEGLGVYTLRVQAGAAEPVMDEEEEIVIDEAYVEEMADDFGEGEIVEQGTPMGRVTPGRDMPGTLGGAEAATDILIHWYHDYTYRAAAGERLTITVQSEELDPFVSIGRGGMEAFEELDANDDRVEDLNSHLEFEVPEAGEYTIRVTTAGPGQVGTYVLRVDRAR